MDNQALKNLLGTYTRPGTELIFYSHDEEYFPPQFSNKKRSI